MFLLYTDMNDGSLWSGFAFFYGEFVYNDDDGVMGLCIFNEK